MPFSFRGRCLGWWIFMQRVWLGWWCLGRFASCPTRFRLKFWKIRTASWSDFFRFACTKKWISDTFPGGENHVSDAFFGVFHPRFRTMLVPFWGLFWEKSWGEEEFSPCVCQSMKEVKRLPKNIEDVKASAQNIDDVKASGRRHSERMRAVYNRVCRNNV